MTNKGNSPGSLAFLKGAIIGLLPGILYLLAMGLSFALARISPDPSGGFPIAVLVLPLLLVFYPGAYLLHLNIASPSSLVYISLFYAICGGEVTSLFEALKLRRDALARKCLVAVVFTIVVAFIGSSYLSL